MIKTKRIAPGLYAFAFKGASYEVEQYHDGMWLTFEVRDTYREYMQDYLTKSAAIADIFHNA